MSLWSPCWGIWTTVFAALIYCYSTSKHDAGPCFAKPCLSWAPQGHCFRPIVPIDSTGLSQQLGLRSHHCRHARHKTGQTSVLVYKVGLQHIERTHRLNRSLLKVTSSSHKPFNHLRVTVRKPPQIRSSHTRASCLPTHPTRPRAAPTPAAPQARTMSISATAPVAAHLTGPSTSRRRSGSARGATLGPWTGPTIPTALSVDAPATSTAASSTARERFESPSCDA